MGCQSEVTLGDNLTFSICTHDPDTGVLTDADAAPTYRIYEDETATAILTGTMAILDNANTTGFYTEQIACTAANGFENDKSYTIYIEATVGGDTGGICYGFLVRTLPSDVWANATRTLTQTAAAVTEAVTGSSLNITRGDTFSATLTGLSSNTGYVSIDFTVKRSRSDSDANAIIRIRKNASGANDGLRVLNGADASARSTNGSITVNSATSLTITLAAAETDDLGELKNCIYDIQYIFAASVQTATEGVCNVTADITRLIA